MELTVRGVRGDERSGAGCQKYPHGKRDAHTLLWDAKHGASAAGIVETKGRRRCSTLLACGGTL